MNNELMQVKIIGEDIELSKLIQDIVPIQERKFTDIEMEVAKKEEFSLVLYRKENPIVKFIKSIKFVFERFSIMRNSREFTYSLQPQKIENERD